MASNLTSRAGHNSRPCSPCARPPRTIATITTLSLSLPLSCHPPLFPRRSVERSRTLGSPACARTRMRNRPTHARARAGQVRVVRPSASKPLEVETLRKYNGDTCPLSFFALLSPPRFFVFFVARESRNLSGAFLRSD